MLTGRTLGGYKILEEVGRGAMGVVFKARQLSMDRDVALKFLPKRLAQDETLVARFLREARAAGQLSHPNIVSVHDVGIMGGLHYIAMEFVNGKSVQQMLKDKTRLAEAETLEIGAQIAGALKAAHARGILHRDVKPDNILIDETGRVRLADLGLARLESVRDGGLTQDGTTVGTPHFMSPEQCNGKVDARSDLYGLGASMYTMASGKTPYEGPTPAAVMVKVLSNPPVSLKKLRPELSPGFVALVDKLMAKDPAMRFADAQQTADAIQLCRDGAYKVPAAPITLPTRRQRPQESMLRSWAFGAAAAIIALLALAIFSSSQSSRAPGTQNAESAPAPAGERKSDLVIGRKPGAGGADDPKSPQDDPASSDPLKQHPAFNHFRRLKNDIAQIIERNPSDALERLHNFQKAHPQAPPTMQNFVTQQIKKAEQSQRELARDWGRLEVEARKESAAGHNTAFELLANFQKAHQGSSEGRDAGEVRSALVKEWSQRAKSAAEHADLDKARQILRDAIAKLPPEDTKSLAADLEQYENQQASRGEMSELNEKAAARALTPETVSGRRYRFAEAAQICRENAAHFKNPQSQRDALSLAQVYEKAAEMLEYLRLQVSADNKVELSNLGSFKSGFVKGWDDRGWTFIPSAELAGLGEQFLPWKLITGEHLVQMAQGLKKDEPQSPNRCFNEGALAFASGAAEAADENLRRAARDPQFKPMADVSLRFLKLPEKPQAPEKNTAGKVEVALAPAPPALMAPDSAPPAKDKPAPKEPDKKDPDKKDTDKKDTDKKDPDKKVSDKPDKKDDSAASLEELKKDGWTEITGNWQRQGMGRFRVTGGGTLITPAKNADVQVTFMLDDTASIGVYVRYTKTGYGVLADSSSASVYTDKLQNSRPLKNPAPAKMMNDIKFLDAHVPHQVRISVRDDKLLIYVDARDNIKSSSDLRDVGDVRIIVTGDAIIESPVVHSFDGPVSSK